MELRGKRPEDPALDLKKHHPLDSPELHALKLECLERCVERRGEDVIEELVKYETEDEAGEGKTPALIRSRTR